MYTVYKPQELFNELNSLGEHNEDVIKFFKNFSFNAIIQQNIAKTNSSFVFKNLIKENTTKSKIIRELNKLNSQNLQKVISTIREIIFQTQDELNDLVNQCIQKIKKDNEQTRPLVAALCNELLSTYFITLDKEKIYFRKLLLNEVKKEYIISIDYNSENWKKDTGERGMILLGTLFNSKIIDNKIMISIINDFKKKIEYKEDGSQEDYENVEKSLQQLSCLLSCIILNEESNKIYNELNLDNFLEDQMLIYEEKKCISKKIRLVCKSTIQELKKIY
jgi:hypothetical protein